MPIIGPQARLPPPTKAWFDPQTGQPLKEFAAYLQQLDAFSRTVVGSPITTGPDAGKIPAFSVHKNGTDQTGVANSTPTLLTWSTEVYDVGNYFAGNAWTPPAGKVHLSAGFIGTPDAGSSTGVSLYFYKNGALLKQIVGTLIFNALSCNGAIDDIANGVDAYTIEIFCSNSAATTNTIQGIAASTFFMGHWISP